MERRGGASRWSEEASGASAEEISAASGGGEWGKRGASTSEETSGMNDECNNTSLSLSLSSLSLSSTYADVGPCLALNRTNVHPVQPNNRTQLGLGHAHAGREVTGLPEGKED